MMGTERALRRLGKMVKERREGLGLTKERAAALAGMSSITWKKVEDGRPVRDDRLALMNGPLDWPDGTTFAVRDGGPAPTDAGAAVDPVEQAILDDPRLTPAQRERVLQMHRDAMARHAEQMEQVRDALGSDAG